MNRDEMIERATKAIALTEVSGYRPVGTHIQWTELAARAVLDAILPQIETVEELEALPDGTVVIDNSGDPSVKEDSQWRVTPSVSVSSANLSHYVAPLTVVWTPQPQDG